MPRSSPPSEGKIIGEISSAASLLQVWAGGSLKVAEKENPKSPSSLPPARKAGEPLMQVTGQQCSPFHSSTFQFPPSSRKLDQKFWEFSEMGNPTGNSSVCQ